MCLTFQMMTFDKYLTKNLDFFPGVPNFGISKCGVSKNDHPSTAYDPTFLLQNPFLLKQEHKAFNIGKNLMASKTYKNIRGD